MTDEQFYEAYCKISNNHNRSLGSNIYIDMCTDSDWDFFIRIFGDVLQMANGDWCGNFFNKLVFVNKVSVHTIAICSDCCVRYDRKRSSKEPISVYQFAKEWMQITSGSLNPILKI